MSLDIESNQLSAVCTILRNIVPDITVWAYGSRISGKAKRFSDSDLPFRVDVIDLASVSPDFKLIVEKAHTVLVN